MQYNSNLNDFISINALPPFDNWNEAADFLDVKFVNGGAQEAVKKFLAPTKQTPPTTAPAPVDLFKLFAEGLQPYINGKVDQEQVIELIKQHAKPHTAKTEIFINDEKRAEVEGRQHYQFEKVLRIMSAKRNVYLYGNAGTGKTQLAENAALALGKDFYCISVCSQSTKSDLMGFMNAGGTYTPTLFRKCYEEGGVFLIDEIDNGNPNILACMNSALANGYCAFPDKMVKRHPDTLIIASANTFGTGANRVFVGRNQLDAATLNRFIQVEINYDEALEIEIFGDIAKPIQKIRKNLKEERAIVSMRNIGNALELMKVGFTQEEAIQICVIDTIPENLRSRC
jgi:hypothetical protein